MSTTTPDPKIGTSIQLAVSQVRQTPPSDLNLKPNTLNPKPTPQYQSLVPYTANLRSRVGIDIADLGCSSVEEFGSRRFGI